MKTTVSAEYAKSDFFEERAGVMTTKARNLFVVFLVSFLSIFGFAQDFQRTNAHPRLGLVLEGGGALGLAHIGVIQYLEEHRIPVGYIAGTSMGGLIGGVYATGRNAKIGRAS